MHVIVPQDLRSHLRSHLPWGETPKCCCWAQEDTAAWWLHLEHYTDQAVIHFSLINKCQESTGCLKQRLLRDDPCWAPAGAHAPHKDSCWGRRGAGAQPGLCLASFTSCMAGTSTAECTSRRYMGCLLSFPFLLRSIAWKVIRHISLNVARERGKTSISKQQVLENLMKDVYAL